MTVLDADRWIDAYENKWIENGPEPDLLAFCNRAIETLATAESDSKAQLVHELAAVDMELRWRRDCQGGRSNVSPRPLDWYRQHLTPFGVQESDLKMLAIGELEVRSRWGDRPDIESFVATQYPMESTDRRRVLETEMREVLELRFPVLCTIVGTVNQRSRVNLRTPCKAGRRRGTDPLEAQISYVDTERQWRLVIADRTENSVSREQLMLKRIAVDRIEVTPLSEKVACYHSDQRLPSHSPTVISLCNPATILSCGSVALHFRRV